MFLLSREKDRATSVTQDFVQLSGSGAHAVRLASSGEGLSIERLSDLASGTKYLTARNNSLVRTGDHVLLAGSVCIPVGAAAADDSPQPAVAPGAAAPAEVGRLHDECEVGLGVPVGVPAKLAGHGEEQVGRHVSTPSECRRSSARSATLPRVSEGLGSSSSSAEEQHTPRQQSFLVNGIRFDVDERYTLLGPIGSGAYGVVCKAVDKANGEKVAIKKLGDVFAHRELAKRTLREIKILRHFDHDNIIRIKDILPPPSLDDFRDVYIASELMDTDLHQIISSPQPLTDYHCQYILCQVVSALEHVHAANVVHRDLKPSNLLLNESCDVKLCDFGMARGVEEGNEALFMTEYVATRWYRAPEMMLSSSKYSKAVDVWSLGCIFAEMLRRTPLFPGKDYIEQLNLIFDVLGTPSDLEVERLGTDNVKRYVRSLPSRPPKPLGAIFPSASPAALALLGALLAFEPSGRLSAAEALQHAYFSEARDESEEPPSPPPPFDFDFDKGETLSKPVLKQLVAAEMLAFNPGAAG